MWIVKGWWVGLLVGALGCSSSGADDDDDGAPIEIGTGMLSGKVGGSDWAFVAGNTDAFLSEDSQFWADMYADSVSPACSSAQTTNKHHLIFNVPKTPGDYRLSLSLNATFVIEGATETTDNLVATKGRMVVDEVTDQSLRGKAHIIFDADNEVNGTFQVTICP